MFKRNTYHKLLMRKLAQSVAAALVTLLIWATETRNKKNVM